MKVDGDLQFRPTGTTLKGALNNIPVSGEAIARYDGKTETVKSSTRFC